MTALPPADVPSIRTAVALLAIFPAVVLRLVLVAAALLRREASR